MQTKNLQNCLYLILIGWTISVCDLAWQKKDSQKVTKWPAKFLSFFKSLIIGKSSTHDNYWNRADKLILKINLWKTSINCQLHWHWNHLHHACSWFIKVTWQGNGESWPFICRAFLLSVIIGWQAKCRQSVIIYFKLMS